MGKHGPFPCSSDPIASAVVSTPSNLKCNAAVTFRRNRLAAVAILPIAWTRSIVPEDRSRCVNMAAEGASRRTYMRGLRRMLVSAAAGRHDRDQSVDCRTGGAACADMHRGPAG